MVYRLGILDYFLKKKFLRVWSEFRNTQKCKQILCEAFKIGDHYDNWIIYEGRVGKLIF